MQLLGLRRGELRVGQLSVDVVGDGLNGRSQARAAGVGAQVAGGELHKTRHWRKEEEEDGVDLIE